MIRMTFVGIPGGGGLTSVLRCTWLGLLLAIAGSAQAKDCSVSRRFQVMQPQALSGVLKDPNGAVLPGIEIELLAGEKGGPATENEHCGNL